MKVNTIGIVCASDTELEPFIHRIEHRKTAKKAMLTFYEGTVGESNVVALYSGVCKVNAAVATQILIDTFHADMVINAGTAGGMAKNVRLFDTIISEQIAYHDVADDILTEFHPWMKSVYFQSDEKLLELAKQYSKTCKYPILFGKMVTGEQFIEDNHRAEINQKYAPLSTDMETAGVAHVCYVNQIPFIAVRTITDTASHIGIENFERNCETSSAIAAEIVTGLIQTIHSEAQ